jgi:hypothetical protein
MSAWATPSNTTIVPKHKTKGQNAPNHAEARRPRNMVRWRATSCKEHAIHPLYVLLSQESQQFEHESEVQ